jgi:hypothetical protein
MNLVKGPAIRQILEAADNDPVEDRFKITDGDQERNIFVGVFGGTADTVVVEASANGYGDKVGMVVAINMAEETLRGIAVSPPTRRLRVWAPGPKPIPVLQHNLRAKASPAPSASPPTAARSAP